MGLLRLILFSNRFGNQIVISVADDLDAGELAQGEFAANLESELELREFMVPHQ